LRNEIPPFPPFTTLTEIASLPPCVVIELEGKKERREPTPPPPSPFPSMNPPPAARSRNQALSPPFCCYRIDPVPPCLGGWRPLPLSPLPPRSHLDLKRKRDPPASFSLRRLVSRVPSSVFLLHGALTTGLKKIAAESSLISLFSLLPPLLNIHPGCPLSGSSSKRKRGSDISLLFLFPKQLQRRRPGHPFPSPLYLDKKRSGLRHISSSYPSSNFIGIFTLFLPLPTGSWSWRRGTVLLHSLPPLSLFSFFLCFLFSAHRASIIPPSSPPPGAEVRLLRS